MYRVKDLEKIIDRDRNTILRWEREGKIPAAQKDSRGWRFYAEEDIQKIIEYIVKNNSHYELSALGKAQSMAISRGNFFEKKDTEKFQN